MPEEVFRGFSDGGVYVSVHRVINVSVSESMTEERWEHGSGFRWPAGHTSDRWESVGPWAADGVESGYWATGRGVLTDLMEQMISREEGSRLWVPSYFCQKVTRTLAATSHQLHAYVDEPGRGVEFPDDVKSEDALLVSNTFGLRRKPEGLEELRGAGVTVIEDHSHDPWSEWARESRADWCVASLRKTLPVPDGAVLWSPSGCRLPEGLPGENASEPVAHKMLASMELKREYLAGHDVAKPTFRTLYKEAESAFSKLSPGRISRVSQEVLKSFPVAHWRERRAENWHQTVSDLQVLFDGKVLGPDGDACTPYAIACLFDSRDQRDRVRERLIDDCVYPAEVWPLEEPVLELPDSSQALSRRMFLLQCDWRYDQEDMQRVLRRFERAIQTVC